MRIACAGNEWYPDFGGGLDRYIRGLAESLAQRGDDVDLYVAGGPNERRGGLNIIEMADRRAGLLARVTSAARTFAREFRAPYDVVNVHFALYGLPMLPFFHANTPLVFNFQGPWAEESVAESDDIARVSLKKLIERIVYARVTRWIVLSAAFGEILRTSFGVPGDRIHVIDPGLDLEFFRPGDKAEARAKLGWPQDRFIAFTARRLVARVGVDELVRAAATVKARDPNVWIAVAGRGPKGEELKALAAGLGLGDTLSMLGYVSEEELAVAYRAADVTILPTQELEGYGYIIPESLSSGTPVITTPIGGAAEAVAPLGSRFVLPSKGADAIAHGLLAAAAGDLALPSAQTCRSFALERYPWEKVTERVRAVFLRALDECTRVKSA